MLNSKDKRDLTIKGVKMHNAGMKYPKTKQQPSVVFEDRVDYPDMYLNAKQAPALVGREVEDNVTLIVKGRITSHSKNERRNGTNRENFNIEIRQIGCLTPKK